MEDFLALGSNTSLVVLWQQSTKFIDAFEEKISALFTEAHNIRESAQFCLVRIKLSQKRIGIEVLALRRSIGNCNVSLQPPSDAIFRLSLSLQDTSVQS